MIALFYLVYFCVLPMVLSELTPASSVELNQLLIDSSVSQWQISNLVLEMLIGFVLIILMSSMYQLSYKIIKQICKSYDLQRMQNS